MEDDWVEWRVQEDRERREGKPAGRLKIYMPIHVLDATMIPELLDKNYAFCPCMQLEEVEDEAGYRLRVARCTVLDHYITRGQAKRCVRHWRQCPFYVKYCVEEKKKEV